MSGVSSKLQNKGTSRTETEKLKVLVCDFGKLEESRKDYILELTRKLADIHCKTEHGDMGFHSAV